MHRHDLRTKHRRGRFANLIPLIVGAIVVVAAYQPAARPEDAVLAHVAAPALSVAASVAAEASPSAAPLSHVAVATDAAPIDEPLPAASRSGSPILDAPQPTPAVTARAAAVTLRATAARKVVFLGDSYTAGWNGAGLGSRGWPQLVARANGWQVVNLAVPGTGFINPGWTKQPVGSRVTAAIRQKPDIIFIAAGHNDSRWSAAATGVAADKVIDRLHRALPNALLVIVAPIWPSGSPPKRCLDLRNHLRQKAASVGAVFIDPLAGKWFAGTNRRFIGPDHIHPTDAGHRHIAERVLAALAPAG